MYQKTKSDFITLMEMQILNDSQERVHQRKMSHEKCVEKAEDRFFDQNDRSNTGIF